MNRICTNSNLLNEFFKNTFLRTSKNVENHIKLKSLIE